MPLAVEEAQEVGLVDDLDAVSCLEQIDCLTHLGRGPVIDQSAHFLGCSTGAIAKDGEVGDADDEEVGLLGDVPSD